TRRIRANSASVITDRPILSAIVRTPRRPTRGRRTKLDRCCFTFARASVNAEDYCQFLLTWACAALQCSRGGGRAIAHEALADGGRSGPHAGEGMGQRERLLRQG